jgi:hypothetical protein
MFPGAPHPRLQRRGPPPWGSQHQNGCLHVVEYNGHGVSPQAEEASSPYGATDRGRSSCPNQASHGAIRSTSVTEARSNAPGRCSNCLKQRPTRLREYPPCHHSRYIGPYRTSIDAKIFLKCLWALRLSRATLSQSLSLGATPCLGRTTALGLRPKQTDASSEQFRAPGGIG